MPGLRCFPAAVLAACLLLPGARAQEPIRFARTPDISPDGKLVAFSYLGDIWTVETIGGVARPVTMHEAHDIYPAFSPDGKWLAFSSNRNGSYDVFVVPTQGGKPRRLTFDSAADLVTGWSPDGKQILFASSRSTAFPATFELYTVPFEGGRVRAVTAFEGKEGVFAPQGDRIAYVRGPGTWFRKGYRGSSNDDVWVCNADGSSHRRVTTFNGQDASPMWAPDGQSLYYVSECCGKCANVVRQDAAGHNKPKPITFHTDDGVRRARISGNGEWIVYECGPDLWVTSTRSPTAARKLAIEVHADDKVNPERTVTFTQGAEEFALSADERHVAFSVHGELFLMPTSGGKATRLTDSPAHDHGIAWAPDSKKLIFASDRNGQEDLYLLEPDDPDHPELVKAHKFKVKQLTNTPEPEIGTSFAPDGKRVAFIRAGRLWTMNPDGSDPKTLVDQTQVIDFEWSPDSKWIVYSRMDGSFASELYILPAAGGPARNVTRYATYNAGVTWSRANNKLAFISQRRQAPSLFVLSLQKPAAPGAPAGNDIDWEDIHLRVQHPAPLTIDEGAIAPDGNRVAFRCRSGGDDLWVANSNGGQLTRLTSGSVQPTQIQWSKRMADVVYFRDGTGSLRMMRTGGFGNPDRVPFSAKMTIRRDEEFAEMFEQSWRALSEYFYDPEFHGVNWDAIRARYRPLVKHVALKEDLYALVSLMLGELNASHLGITGPGRAPEETTADLGLLYDEAYRGPGLKIAEVLKRGPADKRGLNLKPGEIIVAIDGTELSDKVSVSRLLNDRVNETVALQVTANPADPKARRRVEIQAADRNRIGDLMYERWVERNGRRVAELSGGRLGYIHIPSMDEAGLDQFLRTLYSDSFDKEAIVLDVRYNGGGFTHDQVLNYLGGKEHTLFRQRDGSMGLVLRSYDRKWTKPLVLLINNRSYSDAEIFPSAFRTLGLGKLVGEPTGGHVIGTYSTRLIDGSRFRIPRTGVFTAAGVNMEKAGVIPDVVVEPHPDQLARGIDPQLDKAVEVVQQDVVAWKKTRPGPALTPGKPATASASTATPASK
jgi:tricorn protease